MRLTKRQMLKDMALLGTAAALPGASALARAPLGQAVAIVLKTRSLPVRRAAGDLASDIAKVLGATPSFVASAPDGNGLVIEIDTQAGGDTETFRMSRRGRTISLVGADMRGTIYAIYQFAQDYLGVDPMYFWTDNEPARRSGIDMPDGTDRHFPRPVIEYRGFFTNDEDQLTGWAPARPEDHTNIAPAVMDKVYETILRLKGNMVVPSTWPFPDDPQIKAASARGLILNQHHATPVGMNAARWPDKVPYNYSEHPEILHRAWTNAVALYGQDQEIVWTVGLRGLSDVSYASMDPSVVGNDERMGMLVERAIREQMTIVRARFPNAKFVTNLWSEGADLARKGLLKIPEDVIVAWPDEGWGIIQDKGQVRRGQGFYYHVAMLNGKANQLSEMVSVDRIHQEFGRFIRAGANRFALVNVSDVRAVAMTAKATMDVAWGGVPASDARAYYRAWATAEYGAAAAERFADFYTEYFDGLPRLPENSGTGSGLEYGDNRYQEVTRALLLRTMMKPPYFRTVGQSPTWWPPRVQDYGDENVDAWVSKTAAREIENCGKAVARFDRMLKDAIALEPLVRADRRNHYRYAILTMLSFNRNGNAMLLAASRAVQAAKAGRTAEAHAQTDIAAAQIVEMQRNEVYGTYGKWKNWWRGDWLTDIGATGEWIATFKRWLDDPIGTTPIPVSQSDWKGYYHILQYQGNRSVDVR